VLEPVNHEWLQANTTQNLIIVNLDLFYSVKTLNLAQKYEWTEVVITENDSLEVGELFEFLQILMVNDKIETHINQMELFDHIVKLLSLQNLQSIAINE
jgi:hypothetical protein